MTSSNFQVIADYRETKTDDIVIDTMILDDKELVNGLQALGVAPLFAETDGRKLRVHFEKEKCQEVYALMQKALVGIFPANDPVTKAKLEYFVRNVQSEQGWRQHLAMMRNVKYIQ